MSTLLFSEPTLVIWEHEEYVTIQKARAIFEAFVATDSLKFCDNLADGLNILLSGEHFKRAAIYIHGSYWDDGGGRFNRSRIENISMLASLTDHLKQFGIRFFCFSTVDPWTSFTAATLFDDVAPDLVRRAEFTTQVSQIQKESSLVKKFFS